VTTLAEGSQAGPSDGALVMSLLQSRWGPFGFWNWYTDEWLVSRQAARLFFVAIAFVIAVLPVFLGSIGDPAKMSFPPRLAWAIVGMVAPISIAFLWLGMWRYWVRLDNSGVLAKRIWFVILLFGLCYGSCLYYFFIYRPQVARKETTERE